MQKVCCESGPEGSRTEKDSMVQDSAFRTHLSCQRKASRARRIRKRRALANAPLPAQRLLLINKVTTPVLLPAFFTRLGAEGLLLAVADGLNTIGANATLHQSVLHTVSAIIAKRQVVFSRASLVAVPLNGEPYTGMLFQEIDVSLQSGLLVRADVGFIVFEKDILHGLRKQLFFRR